MWDWLLVLKLITDLLLNFVEVINFKNLMKWKQSLQVFFLLSITLYDFKHEALKATFKVM